MLATFSISPPLGLPSGEMVRGGLHHPIALSEIDTVII